MDKNKNRIEELKVVALTDRGYGVAWLERSHLPPVQVNIPFTIPGEVVRVKLKGKKGKAYAAELLEVLVPSLDRVPARCKHFGHCGGCRYQHISYEQQLKAKQNLVQEYFKNLLSPSVDFRAIYACHEPWRYRTKMEYTFVTDLNGHKHLGLIKEGTVGTVFDLTECHLANPWFADTVKGMKAWWEASNIKSYSHNKGSLQSLILREGQAFGDRMAIMCVSGHFDWALQAKQIEEIVAKLRSLMESPGAAYKVSIYLRIKQIEEGMTTNVYDMLLYGPGYIRETLNIKVYADKPSVNLLFHVGSSDFFQPNPRQTERFYSLALNTANISKDAVVYDLYCGSGALGLSIAKYVKQVVGIEFWPDAAANARSNALRNNCNNVHVFAGAVRHTLQTLSQQKVPPPDIVIVNPPRSGLDPEALRRLLELNAPKILYVSCNPATQALNAEYLEQHGYKLTIVQPVDQFPQTYQIECVAVLEKVAAAS